MENELNTLSNLKIFRCTGLSKQSIIQQNKRVISQFMMKQIQLKRLMEKPHISIIVPVYNIEKHLSRCIDSIISQTLQEIEIICVNDYSTDNCQSILDHYAQVDPRIIVIQHPCNQSILQARKSGVRIAKGSYILFVDGDDTLEPTACELLFETMARSKVEICNFPSKVIGLSSKTDLREVNKFIKPITGNLEEDQVFSACYIKSQYGWSLWNKIYQANLIKKAYQLTGDFYCNMAEDLFTYFIISYLAKSYLGIEGEPIHNYFFGLGMTGGPLNRGLGKLKNLCEQSLITQELRKFLLQQNASDKHFKVVDSLEKKFLDECIWYWFMILSIEDCAKGFDILIKYWGSEKVIALLSITHFDKQEIIAQKTLGSSSLQIKKERIKKVGVFYHRMRNGGVERVISLLIPVWIDLGYNVVLFTDEEPANSDFFIPESVDRVVLPTSVGINPEETPKRIATLRSSLIKHDIDVLIHNASTSPMLMYDLLVIKTLGIPAIVSSHECFSSSMFWRDTGIFKKIHVYKNADRVVVLTSVDHKFWTLFGINAMHIPNPLFAQTDKIRQSRLDTLNVIWVGRFAIEKQYIHPIHIFAEVVKEIPEAKLLMLGKGETAIQTVELKSEIERLGLTENVVLCGYFKDITHFYAMSSVYLTTSYHESFSMALIESRAFGIPSVVYELPNLDIFDDNKGVVIVPQGDINAAARAIIQLLGNRELRTKMGMEARQSTELFYEKNNVGEQWSEVLKQTISVKNQPVSNFDDNDLLYRRMFESVLLHYKTGLAAVSTIANKTTMQHSPDSVFTTEVSRPETRPIPLEVLLNFENLTHLPHYVINYGGDEMILVHPIDDVPALCRLKNACPAGTRNIQAVVLTTNPLAKPIDYAMIVTDAIDLRWQHELQQFSTGFCSGWVTVLAAGSESVNLILPEPMKSASHLYLATRLKPGATNEYCWAHFKNIRMTV